MEGGPCSFCGRHGVFDAGYGVGKGIRTVSWLVDAS